MTEQQVVKLCLKIAAGLSALVAVWFLKPFYILDPGNTAIHLRLGRIVQSQTTSGFYFKMPLIDNIIEINNQIIKANIETEALSHDLQFVSIGVAINFRIADAVELYKNIGVGVVKVIIDPCAQESIKAIVAQYTAEGLIQNRHQAKDKVAAELKERLAPYNIILVDFNFVHLDFHKDFLTAVEDKQIAMQSAFTAKNLTEKIKEEALQTRERAEAEAYAMKVKQLSVTSDIISLKAIEKWDGKLPVTMTGGSIPFLSIGDQ